MTPVPREGDSHGSDKQTHIERPLNFEQTLRLKNKPDQDLPEAARRELSAQKIYLGGIHRRQDLTACLNPVEGLEAAWSIELPDGTSIGLPGQTGKRLDRASEDIADGNSTAPQRPEWSGVSYQPRVAEPFHHGRIRTSKGRTIEPFYGIYDNPDARKVYYPQDYPWRCTGRIFTFTSWPTPFSSWSGSGVLIGPRLVLTAGHVAPWGSESWAMLFVPGYWDGASLHGAGARSYVSDYRGWNTGGSTAHDLCLLRLYQPLGSQLGWIGSRTYDDDWEGGRYWVLTGYPDAIAGGNRPAYQAGVPVLDDDDDGDAQQIEHHGDASPGQSGGPMFGFWSSDGPHAIGVTSGGERKYGGFLGIGDEDNNITAGGSAMVDLVKWGLGNWP